MQSFRIKNQPFKNYRMVDFLKKKGPIRYLLKRIFPDLIPFKSDIDNRKGIFVTGIHRSGTSWVSDMLAKAPKVLYWREPFNPSIVNSMKQQYLYMPPHVEDKFYNNFTDRLFKGQMVAVKFDFTEKFNWFCTSHHRHLIKDPTAAFLLEWLDKRYDLDILIIVRHPAAFVSSIMKLRWDFDFNLFLEQDDLMNKYLHPFKNLIIKHNYPGMDERKGSVLWGIIYSVIYQFIQMKGYKWVQYEALCSNPVFEFKKIFYDFNLHWTDVVENALNQSVASKSTFSDNTNSMLVRDTQRMHSIWQERLSKEQIDLIEQQTKLFDLPFYKDEV